MSQSEPLELVLLDNDPQNAMALQQGLAKMGHMVAYATSAEMALQQAERRRPDLAIIQLSAPKAIETAEEMQAKYYSAIVFSVEDSQGPDFGVGNAKPVGFLARPLRSWDLGAVIPAAGQIAKDRSIHRARELMLSGIVDGMLDSVLIIDRRGQVTFANRTSSRLLKRPQAELQASTFASLFPDEGEGNGELKATTDAIFADSGGAIGSGGRGTVLDGSDGRHAVVVIANPVRDDSGKVTAVSLSFRAAPPQAKQTSADALMAVQDLGGRDDTLGRPEKLEPDSGRGDPIRDQAIRALRLRLDSAKRHYAVVLVLSQFDMFRMRYGLTSAEKLLHALSAQVLKTLPPEDRLYQWSSRSLLALCERTSSHDEVRLEMTSLCSRRVDYFLNASERSALVTLSANWTLLPLFDGATIDKVIDQVDGFERSHSRVSN